jgi:hypothetical protein
VTNDAPLRRGLVRPNFLSLWLSRPAFFHTRFFLQKFLGQIFAGCDAHYYLDGALDEEIGGGQLGISVEEYEGLRPAGLKWCYTCRTWQGV